MNDLVAKALAMWSPVALHEDASLRIQREGGWQADLSGCDHWRRTPGRRFAMPGDYAPHALAAERLCRAVEIAALLDALAYTTGYIVSTLDEADEAFAAHFDDIFDAASGRKEGV